MVSRPAGWAEKTRRRGDLTTRSALDSSTVPSPAAARLTPGPRRAARRRVAHLLSEALSPFILVTLVLVWVALLTDPRWWWAALLSAVFFAGIPWLASRAMVRRGLATDPFIRHRRQRHLFYGIALTSMLLGAASLLLVPTSEAVRWSGVLGVGTQLTALIINTRLKISIHALTAALAAVIVPAGLDHPAWWIAGMLVWAAASWSRLELRRHTGLDIVLGSLLGASAGAALLAILGGLPTMG